ncbi:ABC transporter substrate-binding protein [uncultured Paracoccus sp.]|uniref:ABC transporter substrate-binding protein n=1 Tax=uncultured Paracoccus sp. TaxID=189685 RepID=UPI00260591CD|nr:ABC transporter substrate-binding protein [uncultured Paracoccus sp.]
MTITRRTLVASGAALATGLLLSGTALAQDFSGPFTPEEGASLRLLRWVPFVKGDEETWNQLTKEFTDATGVEVRIDQESWEDVRPKAAVAANVGSGPDIVMGWFDDPFQYPDKLVDVTDLATTLGERSGGWYPGPQSYGMHEDKWIAIPIAVIGNAVVYRDSMVKAAGFEEFPQDTEGFLNLVKALKENGTPAGFPHGKAVGDGNNYAHWLLWSHGAKAVDENGEVTINSPETKAAIEYATQLYENFIPGTESWLDINNNRAFLAGEVALTANGVSVYYAAANDPAMKEIADDIRTTNFPIGPVGESVELHQISSLMIFDHTPYPNAAKAYVEWMLRPENYNRWIEGASAYVAPTLKAFSDNPVWEAHPVHAPYQKASENLRANGYAGPLGAASAGAMADYVLVDMFAEAVTGQRTPEEAMENAERRLQRYYR